MDVNGMRQENHSCWN